MASTSPSIGILARGSRRAWLSATCAAGFLLVAFAATLQAVDGLEPCPLCILQRYAFVAVALLALPGAIAPRRLGVASAIAAGLMALAGAGVAIRHLYLQWNPPEWASCLPGIEVMVQQMPLARVLPRIFQGGGECTVVQKFLGLTIPGWSLIWLLALAGACVVALRRRA